MARAIMLSLILQIGETRYALDARQVVEVLPLVQVRPSPSAPPGVAGLMNYRGEPVPVIDLSLLCCGRPARHLLSTRILLVRSPTPADLRPEPSISWIGLIAERATETRRFSADAFVASAASRSLGFELAATTETNELVLKLDLPELFRRFAGAPLASRETKPPAWTSTPSPFF
jgi:chemotaxis-related protein WspB